MLLAPEQRELNANRCSVRAKQQGYIKPTNPPLLSPPSASISEGLERKSELAGLLEGLRGLCSVFKDPGVNRGFPSARCAHI